MDSPIIKLENVEMWYDKGKPSEVHSLKNINLEIQRGEYAAFFGPSGCGKTTLLYAIAGIEMAQQGHVIINNRDVMSLSNQELAVYRQLGVGIVFQQFNLIPSLTVLDNVSLPMTFLGVKKEKRDEEALKLLDRLEIKNLAERFPYELSGGQQQRVGIARALANNPPLIVADEPLGNLDSASAQKVLEFLKELNEKDGRTIIMVTHEVWSLRDAQVIFHMKDGAITKLERPKRKAFAETMAKQLYKELAPKPVSIEVTAQTLSSFLMRGYSIDEIKRFQFFLMQRLNNNIDKETFRAVIDRSYKDGGVGLWKQKADKISNYVEDIIERKKDVAQIFEELEKNPESPLRAEIERIRTWLVGDYLSKLSSFQIMQLDEIIGERLKAIIDTRQFRTILSLSKKKLGLGFSFRFAETVTEKLESLLVSDSSSGLNINGLIK